MNRKTYLERREIQLQQAPRLRKLCTNCLQPEFGCYCADIRRIDPLIKFVILIHPIEAKRRIATGRMSHLCLENSELIVGQDYSQNNQVNRILNDPRNQAAVLYPGRQALNLSVTAPQERASLFAPDRMPVVFVIDGTWATARKTMHLSQNLKTLPQLCFTPTKKSHFRVRKQPAAECLSTIEAIHHLLDLLNFHEAERKHDHLIDVFDKMVERQLASMRAVSPNLRLPARGKRPKAQPAVVEL